MPALARIRGVAGPHRLGFGRGAALSSAWGSSDVRWSYSVANPMGGPWIFDRKAYKAALPNVAASSGAEVLRDHICTAGRHSAISERARGSAELRWPIPRATHLMMRVGGSVSDPPGAHHT